MYLIIVSRDSDTSPLSQMGASLPENVSFFENVQSLKLKNVTSCTKTQYKVNQVALMPLTPMI